ncbi:DUF433 domain-containing protein [Candidatus Nitrospira neomarina]|uniref:DUF433 domain-containing protein n=1 Tax=Candidatus Nitrospira neomarina TaxID=3020899 RepID=A0AA96GHP6_9BACT|nr:DUF433 domain-containing protein [Candidatus Nitrospira neomarina]WNM62091.1 DUF433 domain-containing protein [Candidatus Nitrospira neomarina]
MPIILVNVCEVGYSAPMPIEQLLTRITFDSKICHGKPCIRGLRYPVDWVLELMSSGMSSQQILADYPDLEETDLQAACAFGAGLARVQGIEPLIG